MTKNIMMRVASALLIAVLMTTCAISGTFAKYVTTKSGSDFARVAKWGVIIEAENFELFTDNYKKDDTTATFSGDYSVEASNGKDVLAPGTKGTMANFSITGAPEVAVDVAVVPTVTVSDNWTVDGNFYCPVVITVGTTSICGLTFNNKQDFADAITDAIRGYSKQYEPNTNLATEVNANFGISWAWAFDYLKHQSLCTKCTANPQNDEKDTALGNAAAKAIDGEELTIKIGVAITVTQID